MSEMGLLRNVRKDVQKEADQKRAKVFASFFKTGKGEYAEGDRFLGLTVPQSRKIAVKYSHLVLEDIQELLQSPIHEERLIVLLILVHTFQKADTKRQEEIVHFYLKHTKQINNWDLVDLTADKILGAWIVQTKEDIILDQLVVSSLLWERRIAIVATFALIKQKEYAVTFRLAEKLLNDKHDLMHKATGWMLREVGKRVSMEVLEQFLEKHASVMPRTMLRYAIEHMSQERRSYFMVKKY